jgi:hypothetical protein
MRVLRILILSVVTVCLVPLATPAVACINGVEVRIDEGARLVSKADRALQKGRHKDAIRLIDRALTRKRSARIRDKGEAIRALAVIRSSGRYTLNTSGGKFRGAAAVRVATASLKSKTQLDAFNNPRWKAGLAEGLEATGDPDGALKILEELAGRDLLPDARAFAALSRLRLRAGDVSGANAASTRCVQMGGNALCPLPRS